MPSMSELVAQMGADQEAAYKAYRTVEVMAAQASGPGKETERARLAAELAAQLFAMTEAKKDEKGKDVPPRPVHSPGVRIKVLRLLAYVGGAKEVPAIAKAVDEPELRETARCTLESNPSAEAVNALVQALDQVGSEFRIGVINSLGRKAGSTVAMAAIQKVTGDADKELAMTAVEALANFTEPANDELIAKVGHCPCPFARGRAVKARLRLAENLMKSGAGFAARKIYMAVAASNADAPQKKAAEMALKAM